MCHTGAFVARGRGGLSSMPCTVGFRPCQCAIFVERVYIYIHLDSVVFGISFEEGVGQS